MPGIKTKAEILEGFENADCTDILRAIVDLYCSRFGYNRDEAVKHIRADMTSYEIRGEQ